MTQPHYSCGSTVVVLARCVVVLCLSVGCFGQIDYLNQEVRISDLPPLTAKSRSASDVLATSVAIVFRDKEICCGRKSALVDLVQSADPKSLKDVADMLQGRHPLSDGRPIVIAAEYMPATSVNAAWLIGTLKAKRALIMEWNSHLYVVYGVTFVETQDQSGAISDAIRTLLLLDTRFSDARREVSFNRLTDDWSKVQGLLTLTAAPPQ